jgi:CRP-like cAMP-binding protein
MIHEKDHFQTSQKRHALLKCSASETVMPPQFHSQSALFKGLPEQDRQAVLEQARVRTFAAGEILYHQDDTMDALMLVARGRVRLFQLTPEGHQVILHLAGPGEAVGLLPALTGTPVSASAQAIEAVELWAWQGRDFRALMRRFPDLSFNAIAILGERIHLYQDRIRELTTERVERRLARTLLRLVKQLGKRTSEGILIDLPLSRQHLAEMSGTTLYSASRILRAWEEREIVRSRREQVIILSPHRLVAIAEDLQR